MSTSNIFSNVYIYGNCTVQGTITTLGGSAVSQWTTAGSAISYTSGNVGIGTANPTSILNVNVTGSSANVYNTTGSAAASTTYTNTADSRRAFVGMDGTGLFNFSAGALALGTDNTPIVFAPNYAGGEKMRILTSGYVGIGTNNPGSLLTVSGSASIGAGYNTIAAPTNGLIVQGNVGIGTSNPSLNALQVTGNLVTSGFTSNATNTVFNFDTLTVPFLNATQVGVGTTTPVYALDTVGDINASTTLRIGGLIQPRLISSGTFTGVTTFDTVTFDLVNYNIVEIRMTMYFSTTNQRVMSSQLLDTAGTVYTANESGWQMFFGASTATASGTGANIMNNTEIISNNMGPSYSVIRLTGNQGLSQSLRNHWDWTTVGCYSYTGASTTLGRASVYNTSFVTMNRMRFNLSGGTMTGKYSIINYSS